jgi:regulatory protein
MDGTDGRLAPVTYLPGVVPPHAEPPSVPVPWSGRSLRAGDPWNNTWGGDVVAESVEAGGVEAEADSGPIDNHAERVSLKALTRRGLSQRELERILRDRGLDDATVADELDRLIRVGLIDDLALAQTLVATLQERKGLGRTAIAAELARRMLAPSAIEYALELVDTGDELARAKQLARKRATQLGSVDRETAVRRLSGYLQRRGYSGSTIRAAVDQALPSRPTSSVRFR